MAETRVRRGAGRWPSLLLWGTVIVVGALYLASVEHHRREAQDQDRAAAAAVEPLVPAVPGPVWAPDTPPVSAPALASEAVEPSQVAAGPAPGGRVSDLTPVPVPEAQGTVTLGPSASFPPANPGTESAPPAAAPPMAEPQAVPAATPDAPVTPAEARAFAEAVTEGPPAVPGAPPADALAVEPAPEGAAGDAGATAAAGPAPRPQAPTGPSLAAERARILAEYEAMQRAAQQETRLPWFGRGMAPRGYGVPP
jgi:hypothetical protein